MPARRDLVINTGPLLALTAAGHLGVLPDLFSRVIVPAEVVGEIERGGRTDFGRDDFRAAAWLDKRRTPTAISAFLGAALDRGEAAVIAVAAADGVATVCIDETLGRRMARLHGLSVTGSLGVLLKAKETGLGVMLRPAIARMRNHGIWLASDLEKECLRLAGE